MRNGIVLVIKLVTCMIAFAVGLDLFFDASFSDILWFSLVTTVISYFIGDRILLPRIGNKNSLIADFFMVYGLVWLFGSVVLDNYIQIGWGSVISAFIVTIGEFFVHLIIRTPVVENARDKSFTSNRLAYGMEMAEEEEPIKKK